MKYIHVRHWDYWYAIYNIGNYKQDDANGLEFNITDDEEGEKIFFHFDLLNLPCLEHTIAEDEFMEKDDSDYDLFLKQYNALKNGEMDFFIACLYYPGDERVETGYGFLSLKDCILNGNSIFDLKNKNGAMPYYGVIFVNELKALTREKVVQWIEKLSEVFFLELFQVQFANVPSESETFNSYREDTRY